MLRCIYSLFYRKKNGTNLLGYMKFITENLHFRYIYIFLLKVFQNLHLNSFTLTLRKLKIVFRLSNCKTKYYPLKNASCFQEDRTFKAI